MHISSLTHPPNPRLHTPPRLDHDNLLLSNLKVSSRTYAKLLGCCVKSNSIDLGRELHAMVDVVDDLDPFVGTKLNRWEEVVGLFGMMVEEGILPSHFLVPKILKACGNCGDYEMVRLVHSIVVRCGFGCYTHVYNGLTSAYVRCGWLSLAWEVFTRMMDRDVVSWNSILYAYCRVGMND
ncbi:hypothetical protein Droror1_Dr00011623 [Drosera rotundifolia]